MAKRTTKQQSIINNYYKNREAISLQKLQEAVTELFLTEGKRRHQHWKRVAGHLATLGLSEKRIDHLVEQDNPALVAKVVEELMAKVT